MNNLPSFRRAVPGAVPYLDEKAEGRSHSSPSRIVQGAPLVSGTCGVWCVTSPVTQGGRGTEEWRCPRDLGPTAAAMDAVVLECEPRRWGHIAFPLSQDQPLDSEPLAPKHFTEGEASADEAVGRGTRLPYLPVPPFPDKYPGIQSRKADGISSVPLWWSNKHASKLSSGQKGCFFFLSFFKN